MLLDNQLPALKKTAIGQGKQFLERWASEHGVDIKYAKIAMALQRHAQLKERLQEVEDQIEKLRPILAEDKRSSLEAGDLADLDQELADRMRQRDELTRDLKESFAELRQYESDKETLELFAACSANELRNWADTYSPSNSVYAAQLKKLLSAHAEWETRFGRSREFKAALVTASQVVAGTCLGVMSIPGKHEIQYDLCIVDEASIATPTEVLVPMSRARRTILVGDSKQLSPFQDPELEKSGLLMQFNLTREDQKQTLFNHLAQNLPEGLKKSLKTQHRMLPAIGNLISECFYDGNLQSVEREQRGGLVGTMKKSVVWFSTCKFSNRGSKSAGTSYVNALEVEQVIALLGRTNFELTAKKAQPISVAVLTGYGAQKDRLKAAIEAKRRDWTSLSNVFVNVVDAFQGREADMLIFSVTRSDERGLGFLKEMERINVALSRGKEYLAIIGDHMFCQEAEGSTNPLKSVLDYIRRHPADCLLQEVAP